MDVSSRRHVAVLAIRTMCRTWRLSVPQVGTAAVVTVAGAMGPVRIAPSMLKTTPYLGGCREGSPLGASPPRPPA